MGEKRQEICLLLNSKEKGQHEALAGFPFTKHGRVSNSALLESLATKARIAVTTHTTQAVLSQCEVSLKESAGLRASPQTSCKSKFQVLL